MRTSEPAHPSKRPTITQVGPLSNLPVELLYRIVKYLRTREVACLSLTCHELYQNEHLQQIWTSDLRGPPRHASGCKMYPVPSYRRPPKVEERLRFFMLMWMDLPNHSVCGRCFTFYKKYRPLSGWFDCGDCGKDRSSPLRQVIAGHSLPGWCMRAVWDYVAYSAVRDKPLDCLTLEKDWQTHYDNSGEIPATWWIRSTINVEMAGWLPVTHACQRLLHTLGYRRSNPERQDLTNQLLARRAIRSLRICEGSYHSPLSKEWMTKWSMSDITKFMNDDKAWKKTSETRRCIHYSTEYRWTVYRHGSDIIEIVLDTWRIFDLDMVSPYPLDSLNQYSARSFPGSNASNLDNIALRYTDIEPPQKLARSAIWSSNMFEADEIYRFGPKTLRALKSTSLWT